MKLLKIFLGVTCLLTSTFVVAESAYDKKFWQDIKSYRLATSPQEREEIEKKIWATYSKTNAVVVIDTSGFTLRSNEDGIVNTLAVIEEMRTTVSDIMAQTPHGSVIKFEADNAFLRFDTPQDALDTVNKIKAEWNKAKSNIGDKHPILLSIGIGYGPTLMLSDDAYSRILNITSKLGEDTAEANEVLLTEEAYKALKKPVLAEEKIVKVSNVNIRYYKIK